MRTGALRQRLKLQSPPTVADGMGGINGAWTDVATVWGQIEALAGTERLQAGQVTADLTHEIIIRYQTATGFDQVGFASGGFQTSSRIVPKMRVVRQQAGGQTFEVHAVQNTDFRNRQLVLLCSEIQVTGA